VWPSKKKTANQKKQRSRILKYIKINIWRILHTWRWPCRPKHVVKDSGDQHTIKLHTDEDITCNTHWKIQCSRMLKFSIIYRLLHPTVLCATARSTDETEKLPMSARRFLCWTAVTAHYYVVMERCSGCVLLIRRAQVSEPTKSIWFQFFHSNCFSIIKIITFAFFAQNAPSEGTQRNVGPICSPSG
jgi:hypothetical protein